MKACRNIQKNIRGAGKKCQHSSRDISKGYTKSLSASIAAEKYDSTTESHLPLSKMPGPGGLAKLPYIGPLFLFHPFSRFKPETYGALVSTLHDRYGPVFKTRLDKGYCVHTSCIEDIATIFQQEPMYPLRRLNFLSKIYRERNGLPQGLGSCNGPEWHTLRTSMNAPLNRPKACMAYLPAQNEVTDDLIVQLLEVQRQGHGDKLADKIFDLLFRFSTETVAYVCFNERLGFLTDTKKASESKVLLDAIYTYLNSSFKAIIGLERKFLKTENDSFYQQYAAAVQCIRQQAKKYLDKSMEASHQSNIVRYNHRDGKHNTEKRNLLMALLQNTELETEHILVIIESLLIAGTDSTARNLTFIFYNLATHPEIQQRLKDEVIDVLGPDGQVTVESLAQIKFLKACVKESMRLFPPISPGPERILSQDTILSGYLVPEGTSVIMSSVKTSQNPRFFPDPLSFRPDRWMRVDGKKTSIGPLNDDSHLVVDPRLAALAFLPFSFGKRSCAGRRFAELEIFVCVAKVIQRLHVSVDPNYDSLKIIHTPFVTPVKSIPFVFTEHTVS